MSRTTRGLNRAATLAAVALMIATGGWPAVTVRENLIREGNFSSGRIGGPPPKPWLFSKNVENVRATIETPAGRPESERWVRLVDDNDEETANIRQSFGPVTNGVFQARLISNKDGGRLFFILGGGSASKPGERAMQLCIESEGPLAMRTEQKARIVSQIKTGEVYLVRCDFETIKNGRTLRVLAELVEERTGHESHAEIESEAQVAITAVRVTSTKADTGVDYYVTDVSLTSR